MTEEEMTALISDIRALISELQTTCRELEYGLNTIKKKRAPNGTFDRNKYQREYMRDYMAKRRAEARRPKGSS